MLNTGRRALVGVVAGGMWIGWGFRTAHAVAILPLATCAVTGSLLLLCCGYCIAKGRKRAKTKPASPRHPRTKAFLIVILLEAAGLIGACFAARQTERLDALPHWVGLVVGMHFLGLAKALQIPIYYVTGVGITLWCFLSWILFHGDTLIIFACFGTGTILWATSSFNLLWIFARSTSA